MASALCYGFRGLIDTHGAAIHFPNSTTIVLWPTVRKVMAVLSGLALASAFLCMGGLALSMAYELRKHYTTDSSVRFIFLFGLASSLGGVAVAIKGTHFALRDQARSLERLHFPEDSSSVVLV